MIRLISNNLRVTYLYQKGYLRIHIIFYFGHPLVVVTIYPSFVSLEQLGFRNRKDCLCILAESYIIGLQIVMKFLKLCLLFSTT